jgi:hypothetical protein
MRETRRAFLQKTAAATAGLVLAGGAPGISSLPPVPLSKPRRELLFDRTDVPRIRKTLELARFRAFWDSWRNADLQADKKFLSEELRLNNHVKDFLRARLILERSAFVYAITHDRAHLEIALLAMEKILAYKRWDYFLEGGKETIGLQRAPEATIAMSCAREWLSDALSEDQKREIERQIAEKGAAACYLTLYGMKYPDRVRGWGFDPEDDYQYRFDLSRWPFILNSTNLKAIPIAGLAMAGSLLYDTHPQAHRWVDMALTSARAFSTMFGPDGAYDEGVGYWGYTTQHLTMFSEVLWRRLGLDARNIINYPGTVRYGLRMSMPTVGRPEDCVNFGDAWKMGDVSVAAWTAREKKDRIAQYVALRVGEVQSHLHAIWYDPLVAVATPGLDLEDVRFSNDVVVSRTGWDQSASLVAFRSGGPANHEHADRNSVIFMAHGERMYHDPYHAAYSYTEPHWKLRLTEAHTAILIGGKGHQYHNGHEGTNASWAEAKILRYDAKPAWMIATSDATEAYRLVNSDVALVMRTVIYVKPDVLVIVDRVKLHANPLPVQARFQIDDSDGKGEGSDEPDGFVIRRPAVTLRGVCKGTPSLVIRSGRLDLPEQYGIHPYLEVESASGLDHLLITAAVAARGPATPAPLALEGEGGLWTITGSHGGKKVRIHLAADTDIPVVTL